MPEDLTPEERLLRLIRGDKKGPDPQKGVPDVTLGNSAGSGEADKPPEVSAKIDSSLAKGEARQTPLQGTQKKKTRRILRKRFLPSTEHKGYDDIVQYGLKGGQLKYPGVFRLMILALFAAMIFLAWQMFFRPAPEIKDFSGTYNTEEGGKEIDIEPSGKPLASYLQKMGSRDLFRMFEPEEKKKPKIKDEGPKLEEVRAQFSLIGVFLDEEPQAIVQDRKTRSSHSVYVGDSIGDVSVEAISEGRVRFSYKGETFELRI